MDLVKTERVIVIPHIKDTHSEISSERLDNSSVEVRCEDGCGKFASYYISKHPGFDERNDVYLFPFLLNRDGTVWEDANLFFFSKARDKEKGYSSTDGVREKASHLLDYKIYCEDRNIDIFNFTGRRVNRPTYRYFFDLLQKVNEGVLTRGKLNKLTKVVYDFYKYLSEQVNSRIDIERVDTVEEIRVISSNSYGRSLSIPIEKRGLSLRVSSAATLVPIGYVREDGEDLRPLTDSEVSELIQILCSARFSQDERLMHFFAMETGARKQTILTIRRKHIKEFSSDKLRKDGTYILKAGPGTSIDTKFNKKQTLYVPKSIADQLKTYANCKVSQNRLQKFLAKNDGFEGREEAYLFLSPEGNPHYMAKNDPKYKATKSKPQGRNTYYMKRKLFECVGDSFPKDFVFHWLRATYALRYYRYLQPLAVKGLITDGDIISMVQKRLHHLSRETTEHYLKLFDSVSDRLAAQEIYEQKLDLYGGEIRLK